MLSKNRRVLEGLSLGILLCVCSCIGLIILIQKTPKGNPAIRTLVVEVELGHRSELFDQLQKFADKHGFRFSVREVKVVPDGIFIYMSRNDLEISAVSDASDPSLLDFVFHEKDPDHPTSKDIIDDLFNELKSFISEVPNIEIIEQ